MAVATQKHRGIFQVENLAELVELHPIRPWVFVLTTEQLYRWDVQTASFVVYPDPLSGGVRREIVVTSGSYQVGFAALTDYVYLINGAHEGTMPVPAGNSNLYSFRNLHSAVVFLNAHAVIEPQVAARFNGEATYALAPGQTVEFIGDGVDWWSISAHKITVGTTAPSNPAVKDVWIDTN